MQRHIGACIVFLLLYSATVHPAVFSDDDPVRRLHCSGAPNFEPVKPWLQKNAVRFQENKGQIVDAEKFQRPDIIYSASVPGAQLFLRKDGISTVFSRYRNTNGIQAAGSASIIQRVHTQADTNDAYRMDVTFLGSNPGVKIRAESVCDGVVNFYLPQCPNGLFGVREYGRIVYENIYSNIDMEMFSVNGKVKYNFVVHPGGNVGDIRMRYDGATTLSVSEDGRLVAGAPLGGMEEAAPLSWCGDENNRVASRFVRDGSVVSFAVGSYDARMDLVIDPWSTYFGGSGRDGCGPVAVDANGNVFATGYTFSANLPVTNGSILATPAHSDVFVVKFKKDGTREWATYYGGSFDDEAHGLALDANGNPVIAGGTRSADLPVLHCFQCTKGNTIDWDAFVAKFDASGVLLWASYCGGSGDDIAYGAAVDGTGGVFVVGTTQSPDFPVLMPYQTTLAGGSDAFLIRLTGNGSRVWATYFGGNNNDMASGVAADAAGNAYVTGSTQSANFPTLNGYQSANAGGSDSFMAEFTSAGAPVWSTYYGGSLDEQPGGVAFDHGGNVYFTGCTQSTDFPTLAPFQSANAGMTDLYAVKMNMTNGAPIWSTYYGGSGGDFSQFGNAGSDASGNLFVTGLTYSIDFPLISPYQSARLGMDDALLVKFSSAGTPLLSSLYGGSDEDWGCGVAAGGGGDIIISGITGSSDFPTQNAFQSAYGGAWDAFITIFGCLPPTVAKQPASMSACPGDTVSFVSSSWFTPKPIMQWRISTDAGLTWTNLTGKTDTVLTIIAADSMNGFLYRAVFTNTCTSVASDSALLIVKPGLHAGLLVSGDTTFCQGGFVRFDANQGMDIFFRWQRNGVDLPGATSDWYEARETGVYRVSEWNSSNCHVFSRQVKVQVLPLPFAKVLLSGDSVFCEGGSVTLNALGSPGFTFRWSRNGDPISGETGPSLLVTKSGWYRVKVRDASKCEDSSAVITVMVHQPPQLAGTVTKQVCAGSSVAIGQPASGGAPPYQYSWSPPDGLSAVNVAMPLANPLSNATYVVTVIDSLGCSATDTVYVKILPQPAPVITGPVSTCLNSETTYKRMLAGQSGCAWSVQNGSIIGSATADTIRVHWTMVGAGKVLLTVRLDSSGCAKDTTLDVTVQSFLTPVISSSKPVPLCPGDSVALDAGPGYASYQWSGGEKTQTIMVRDTGTFFVSVRDAGGCSGISLPFIVKRNAPPDPKISILGNVSFCEGDSVALDAGSGFKTYAWSSGDSSRRIIVRTSGDYSVIVSDSSGCAGTSQPVAIQVITKPYASILGARSTCLNSAAQYQAQDTTAVNFNWSATGGIILSGGKTKNVSVQWNAAGTGALKLTVTNSQGCTADTSIQVQVQSSLAPSITALGPTVFCKGDSVLLEADAGYTGYKWSTGDTTRSIVIKNGGAFTVAVTDAGGCSGTAQPVTVAITSKPSAAITGPSSVCLNRDASFSVPSAGGTYNWSVSRGVISSGAGTDQITIRWNAPGIDTVHVSVTSGAGCVNDSIIIVAVNTSLQPVISPDKSPRLCLGDSITLDAGAGYAIYQWSTGATQRLITVNQPGTYTVDVQDASGCSGKSPDFVVTNAPKPVPVISGKTELCEGDSSTLDAGAGFSSYAWSTGSANRTAIVSQAGQYSVVVIDTNGCAGTAVATVAVHAVPAPVITQQGNDLVSTAASAYQWYRNGSRIPGATGPQYTPADSGSYTVVVTNQYGCTASSSAIVIARSTSTTIGLSCPSLPASAAGAIVQVPLMLESSSQLTGAAATSFEAQVRFNRSVLSPMFAYQSSRFINNDRLITLTANRPTALTQGTLLELPFMVLLGDAPCATVHLDSLRWLDGIARVNLQNQDCEICVEVCREGGNRLFSSSGKVQLFQNQPNPFNAQTVIAFDLIERGYTELSVYDVLGKKIATLVSGESDAGHYRVSFDASAFASGIYFYYLSTPSQFLQRRMILTK